MKPLLTVLLLLLLVACCTTCRQNESANSAGADSPRVAAEVPGVREAGSGAGGEAETTRPGGEPVRAVVNKEYEQLALDMLAGATQSILVVHFECNQDSTIDKIVQQLVAARERGVTVKVLLEAEVDDNPPRVEELISHGIEAKLDTSKKYTHSKLFVVDRKKVLFGSTNLSYKSIRYNNETNLYVENDAAAEYYAQYAEALYADPDLVPTLTAVSVPAIGLKKTLHDGDYFETVLPMLNGAATRVHLLVYGFNINPDYPGSDIHKLADALAAATERGVDVKVILEESDYNDTLNEINQRTADYLGLKCVPVRFEPLDIISHAKLLLVDDEAVVGSNNWGYGGLYLYHEVGGVTDNSVAVEKLSSYFDGIWEESSPATAPCRTN